MKNIEVPYDTILEKLANNNLVKTFQGIKEKWLGTFNKRNFGIILEHNKKYLKDDPLLTEGARMRIIDGSFSKFDFFRKQVRKLKENWYKPHLRSLETNEETIEFFKDINKKYGEDYVNQILSYNLGNYRRK